MKTTARAIAVAFALGACFAPGVASAFTSPSTGADGAFSPTVNTVVALPPSGIFNYTSVNIPAGVTVKFLRNTTNTPVVILATGDVTIAGTLDVSGTSSANVGAAGDGALGDDGTPGIGGPGGFAGGSGGLAGSSPALPGGTGLGPGGGPAGLPSPGSNFCSAGTPLGGGGGGFSASGGNSSICGTAGLVTPGGVAYGSSQLLPLIGGSGGGAGAGGVSLSGSGGGGGGGALLIAASGTVSVTGTISASGGASGSTSTSGNGSTGGGGSGGAIRIIATTLSGNGTIAANGGAVGTGGVDGGGAGAAGRIRLEAETFNRTAATTPTASINTPGPVFVTGSPSLAISSVAGVSAPVAPTGNADITLPSSTPNPVTVVFTTTGVPVGNTVQLTLTPAFGAKTTVVSPALTGDTTSATASVSVNLPVGPSVLQAQTTYTIVAALGDLLRNFAGNERVEKIRLSATLGGKSKVTLVTVSGKEYDAPAEALRIAALGG